MNFFELAVSCFPQLLSGARNTLILTVASLIFAMVIGLIAALMRLSSNKLLRAIAAVYINIIRGTPLLVQILYIYFGIPMLTGVHMKSYTAGIITFSIYSGAYLCEIIRAGVLSVDHGQTEGGLALGFSKTEVLFRIVLPQALRRMIPTFVNQITMCIKDTSLLSTIGVMELTFEGQTIYAANFRTLEILSFVAAIYFVIVYLLTRLSQYLERRLSFD